MRNRLGLFVFIRFVTWNMCAYLHLTYLSGCVRGLLANRYLFRCGRWCSPLADGLLVVALPKTTEHAGQWEGTPETQVLRCPRPSALVAVDLKPDSPATGMVRRPDRVPMLGYDDADHVLEGHSKTASLTVTRFGGKRFGQGSWTAPLCPGIGPDSFLEIRIQNRKPRGWLCHTILTNTPLIKATL